MIFQVSELDVETEESPFISSDIGKWVICIDGHIGGYFNTKEDAVSVYHEVWFHLNS